MDEDADRRERGRGLGRCRDGRDGFGLGADRAGRPCACRCGADGFGGLECGREGDAEEAAERTQGAPGGGGGGEQGGEVGLAQQGFKLRAAAGGVVAELVDEPAVGGGRLGCADAGRTFASARPRGAQGAGGEAVHEADEAGGGALQAEPERDGAGAEGEVAAADEGDEGGADHLDPPGEFRGEGLGREVGDFVHYMFYTGVGNSAQGEKRSRTAGYFPDLSAVGGCRDVAGAMHSELPWALRDSVSPHS